MKVSSDTKPRQRDPIHADCPGRDIFDTVTNRWTFLILWSLRAGPLRFFELRETVEGISERVLSENLKKITREGLVERHVEVSRPPKVSYSLTPMGGELAEVIGQLTDWIGRRFYEIEEARLRYDKN